MDAGCYILLILFLPATFLLHTWQTHSGLGKTHPQLCCCVGHLHCLSLRSCPALNHAVQGSLSFSLLLCHISYTATVLIFKAPFVLPQSHPSSLTGHCVVYYHLQPALKLDSIIHYLFPLPPKSIFVLSPAITHRDMILTLHNIMADVSFFTLQLLLTMTTKIPFSFLKQHFYCISQENLC